MKRYEFSVVIEEGNDEFWEEILEDGKSGADDVRESLLEALQGTGWVDAEVRLVGYSDRPESVPQTPYPPAGLPG